MSREDLCEIATTRPETLLGDTAVAVNPEDERYMDLIGKNVDSAACWQRNPCCRRIYMRIRILGTGAVKITPAHDPNDFEVGKTT